MYTTPAKVLEVVRNLPTRLKEDTTYIESNIAKADTIINAELAEVYVLPLDPVPDLIEFIATDLAVFFIHEDLYSSQQPNQDNYYKSRYKRALELLEKIALGDLYIETEKRRKISTGFANSNTQQIFSYDDPEW